MTKKDIQLIALILHDLEDKISDDWYEVINTFVGHLVNIPTFDANEFRRVAAGGRP